MKAKFFLLACAALILAAAASAQAEEANAVYNSGFEQSYADRVLGWTGAAYKGTSQAVRFFPTDTQKKSGARSFVIANLEPNDAYLIQWVKVKPKTSYRVTAWVFAEGIDSSTVGASVCVYGIQQAPEFVLNTSGEWKKLEFYAQSGPDQTLIPLALRLGFYGTPIKGTAAFDDISLTRTKVLPDGAVLYKFYDDGKTAEVINAKGMVPASVILLIVVLFGLALLGLAAYIFRHKLLDLAIRGMEGGLALVDRHLLPAQPDGRDRRISPRLVYGMPAFVQKSVQGGGNRITEYHCSDVSREGFYLKVDNLETFQIDDFVNCLFKLGEHRYDVGPAKVVRKQRELNRSGRLVDSGIGLRFTSNSSADRARVTMLIKALQDATEAEAGPWSAADKGLAEPKKSRIQLLAQGIAARFKKKETPELPPPVTTAFGRLLPGAAPSLSAGTASPSLDATPPSAISAAEEEKKPAAVEKAASAPTKKAVTTKATGGGDKAPAKKSSNAKGSTKKAAVKKAPSASPKAEKKAPAKKAPPKKAPAKKVALAKKKA